jgi:hypothetical protein
MNISGNSAICPATIFFLHEINRLRLPPKKQANQRSQPNLRIFSASANLPPRVIHRFRGYVSS